MKKKGGRFIKLELLFMKLQGFFKKMVAFSFAFALFAVAQAQSSVGTVLVTGAAGRTGRQVYSKLKAQGNIKKDSHY